MNALADVRVRFDYLSRRRSFAELAALAREAYAGPPRRTHTDESLWRAFPRGYVGAWIDGTLRGCIHLWPLDGQRAGDVLIGARSEQEVTEADFATVCNSPRTVWYFSGLVLAPEWRGRGLAAHLLAEALMRWSRDLPCRPPLRFAALAESQEGLRFIEQFGMELIRPATETADGLGLYGRTVPSVAALLEIARSAAAAADRKGRLVDELAVHGPGL